MIEIPSQVIFPLDTAPQHRTHLNSVREPRNPSSENRKQTTVLGRLKPHFKHLARIDGVDAIYAFRLCEVRVMCGILRPFAGGAGSKNAGIIRNRPESPENDFGHGIR